MMSLVGRDTEIGMIEKEINNYISLDEDSKVMYFYGKPGIGKTSIRREIERKVNCTYKQNIIKIASMDFENNEYEDKFSFVYALYFYLSEKYDIPFDFCNILRYCYQEKYPGDPIVSMHIHKESSGMKLLYELACSLSQTLSIYDKIKKVIAAWNSKMERDRDLCELEVADMDREEIKENFCKFFCKDLKGYCKMNKVIILLDTYEKINFDINLHNQTWVLKDLICELPNVFWIVFGTQSNAFKIDIEDQYIKKLQLIPFEVKEIPEAHAAMYLHNLDVKNKEIEDLIIKQSMGNPAVLSALAEIYQHINKIRIPQKEDFLFTDSTVSLYDNVYNVYKKHISQYDIVLICALSEFDSWDENLYHQMCVLFNHTFQFESFKNHCMVEIISEKIKEQKPMYRIINIAKEYFVNLNTGEQKKMIYSTAFSYFCDQLKQFKLIENMDNQELFNDTAHRAVDVGLKLVFYKQEKFYDFINWVVEFTEKLSSVGMYYLKIEILKRVLSQYADPNVVADVCKDQILQCYFDLSWAYYALKYYREALDYGFKSFLYSIQFYVISDEKVVRNIYHLGNILQYMGDYETSIWMHDQALKFRKKKMKKHSSNVFYKKQVALSLNSLAYTYMNLYEGNKDKNLYDKAKKLFEQATELRERLLKEAYNQVEQKQIYISLQKSYGNMSKLYFINKKYKKAYKFLNKQKKCIIKERGKIHHNSFAYKEIHIRKRILDILTNKDTLENVKKDLESFSKENSKQFPSISSTTLNNIAILEALSGNLDLAKDHFLVCLNEKKIYYTNPKNKKIKITLYNLEIVQGLMDNKIKQDDLINAFHFEY